MPGILRKWFANWSHKVLGSFLGLTISILIIRSDEKPLDWPCKRSKVATNSPATNRTTKQNAACRAMRARIQRARDCERSPPLSTSTGRIAEARSAGATPNNKLTPIVRTPANASARQSIARERRAGVVGRIDSREYERRGPLREAPADGGGKQPDDCSLNQDQLPEAPSPCADGDTERHFKAPGRGLRGHQVCYVRTGNQQHQHDEYAEGGERGSIILLHRGDSRGRGVHFQRLFHGICLRIVECANQRAEVVAHRRGRYARLQVHKSSEHRPLRKRHPPMHHGGEEDIDHLARLGAVEAHSRQNRLCQ